jgi:hypothetical protein
MQSTTHSPARIAACVLVACALTIALNTAIADAASPPITVQAAAANAAFLAYAPPPPGGARALCLVDTGVNPTPDTTPGLVSATALDGGTGNDVDPLTHGTINAAVAGGSGYGVLGAWPRLKIVSVRATDNPSPGQLPTFQFDDYRAAIKKCVATKVPGAPTAVIALPLASVIPPTPDQARLLADAVADAQAEGISILAAAGNDPGPIQLPGSQPGILPVGAGDPANGICPFSASEGLTFYAPGCSIDQIDTRGETFCCGNGTSQAVSYAAGVLVALRSYKPELTATEAVQHLLATTHNGHLDVAVAFRTAGLDAVVDAGNAAIPMPPPPPPASGPRKVPRPSIQRVTWRRGVLDIRLKRIPHGARLHVKITFARRAPKYIATLHLRVRVRAPAPRRVLLRQTRDGASSATVTARVIRLR